MADDHHRLTVKSRQPTHNGWIVRKTAVAMQFLEISEYVFDVVQRVRTLSVTRNLRNLNGRELGKNVFG